MNNLKIWPFIKIAQFKNALMNPYVVWKFKTKISLCNDQIHCKIHLYGQLPNFILYCYLYCLWQLSVSKAGPLTEQKIGSGPWLGPGLFFFIILFSIYLLQEIFVYFFFFFNFWMKLLFSSHGKQETKYYFCWFSTHSLYRPTYPIYSCFQLNRLIQLLLFQKVTTN